MPTNPIHPIHDKITQYDFFTKRSIFSFPPEQKFHYYTTQNQNPATALQTKISPTFSEFRRNRVDALEKIVSPPRGLEVGPASGKWVAGGESNYANM